MTIPKIVTVEPPDVEEGGPVTFEGEHLGLVNWAVFTDKNKNKCIAPARGEDVGRAARVEHRPKDLITGAGTAYLSTADDQSGIGPDNSSNEIVISFVEK
ncbi:hypothetical protein [Embleya sp. NPDC059237]|uniref:hypothetical protein n=1 Tax=Embleya sp. NPDC059237 TaxID=3346784 RepID=UPI00369BE0D2